MSNSCQLLENFFKINPISSSQKDSQCYTKKFIAGTNPSAISTNMKEKSSTICVRKYSHNVIQIRLQSELRWIGFLSSFSDLGQYFSYKSYNFKELLTKTFKVTVMNRNSFIQISNVKASS